MRRRILQSTLLVVAITALVLGGPLVITTWQLVKTSPRRSDTSGTGVHHLAIPVPDRASAAARGASGGGSGGARRDDQVIGVDVGPER